MIVLSTLRYAGVLVLIAFVHGNPNDSPFTYGDHGCSRSDGFHQAVARHYRYGGIT
jgi:hypothetical protein